MESVARLSSAEQRELFAETAARKGMTPAIVEKDFWVCWTLGRLFANSDLSRLLMFKGGTSLSKVFNLIERFSEDIDLILDWHVVIGEDDPLAERSATKQEAMNRVIDAKAVDYIWGELLAMVARAVDPVCRCELAADDLHALNVMYPAAFSDAYLRPEVRLEIGPLAGWMPFDRYSIKPYAAEAFPQFFKQADCAVQAIRAERTFWEKAAILHHEANRPEKHPAAAALLAPLLRSGNDGGCAGERCCIGRPRLAGGCCRVQAAVLSASLGALRIGKTGDVQTSITTH
jgi:hypothetical protein